MQTSLIGASLGPGARSYRPPKFAPVFAQRQGALSSIAPHKIERFEPSIAMAAKLPNKSLKGEAAARRRR
jgi:hypothetical protein